MKISKYLAFKSGFRKILLTFYFGGCFIFFAVFYKYHLYYLEQMQFFRVSWNYIARYFHKPALFSSLIGDFLTQFYFLKAGGAVIITGCLLLLWYLIDRTISRFVKSKYSYLLALLVTALITGLHLTIVYPLSATISLIIALAAFHFYVSLNGLTNRIIGGLILVPVIYITTGFAVFLFFLIVLLYEFKIKQIKGWKKWTYNFVLIAIVFILPISMRTFYYLTEKQAYKYPLTELSKPIPNFTFETLFGLDYEWYSNHPEKTIELARKTPMKTRYVIYYYNLASAALNKLPENLLSFDQEGLNGIFVPFNEETNYLNLLFGNEVYYFIGDINASQHYVLMANTFSPRSESTRMIRRMVEDNIINGEYAVAQKYIKMLEQTLFYRRWAQDMEQFLYNDDLSNKTPWIASKRAKMPIVDHIKSNPNYFVQSLYYLLDDHPDNQAALEYLLNICLLYKDITSFYNALVKYKYQYTGNYLPKLYQEALIIYSDMHKNDVNLRNFQFSGDVIRQSALFKQMYQQNFGDKRALTQSFGNTYWFYYGFAVLPK